MRCAGRRLVLLRRPGGRHALLHCPDGTHNITSCWTTYESWFGSRQKQESCLHNVLTGSEAHAAPSLAGAWGHIYLYWMLTNNVGLCFLFGGCMPVTHPDAYHCIDGRALA